MSDDASKAAFDPVHPFKVVEREQHFFVEASTMQTSQYCQAGLFWRDEVEASGHGVIFGFKRRMWADMLAETLNTIETLQTADVDRRAERDHGQGE